MIELTADQFSFMSIAFALLGALVGALATLVAARVSAERLQTYVESAKFRSHFVEEIIKLRLAHEDTFHIISDAVMARHRIAKVLFEPWVQRSNAKLFTEAWTTYEATIKTTAPGSLDNRKRECDVALGQIEKLLSFATHRG